MNIAWCQWLHEFLRTTGVLESREDLAAGETPEYLVRVKMFPSRMQHMPPRHEEGLWSTQIKTIRNL